MIEKDFIGPVFIVGMPRSGTKILRDLLNNHSQIDIPPVESHLIPELYHTYESYGNLKDPGRFEVFFADFSRSFFYKRIAGLGKAPGCNEWHAAIESYNLAGVLEAFYRHYVKSGGKIIWGDKTPTYLIHLDTIHKLFPNARIIHIYRDVRDYSLSIRRAWNKNMYRAAQRWADSLAICRQSGRQLYHKHFLEVRYEDLLDKPETVLRQICRLLEIQYEVDMTVQTSSSENFGAATGHVGILKHNYNKWRSELSPRQVTKIEQIARVMMLDSGYPLTTSGQSKRIGNFEMKFYHVLDAWNIFIATIKELSLREGIEYIVKYNRHRKYL